MMVAKEGFILTLGGRQTFWPLLHYTCSIIKSELKIIAIELEFMWFDAIIFFLLKMVKS